MTTPQVDTSRILSGAARLKRAERIVNRVMPLGMAPHGFYDPQGFVESCRRSARRNALFREVMSKLRVKDGGYE